MPRAENDLPCRTVLISSASASGISIVNSYKVREWSYSLGYEPQTDLLDSHDDLDGVQTIQTQITGERSLCSEL